MEIKYGDDNTNKVERKEVFKEKKKEPNQKMIKNTPNVMSEAMFYHSFMKGCKHC